MPIQTLILCTFLAFAPVQQPSVQEGDETSPQHRALLKVEGWPDLVARDRRLSFGMRTGSGAVAELERRDSGEAQQSAAVLALGAAQVVSERARIEHWVAEGRGDVCSA